MGVTMTDGPHYYNGAKFTVRMDVGYEVCCSEGNFKDATINAKIEYSKTAEELKALADQGDMSWCPVEGAKNWEDCQVILVKMVQGNLVNFYNEADLLTVKDETGTTSVPVEKHGDFYYLPKRCLYGFCVAISHDAIYYCRDSRVMSQDKLTAENLKNAKKSLVAKIMTTIAEKLLS